MCAVGLFAYCLLVQVEVDFVWLEYYTFDYILDNYWFNRSQLNVTNYIRNDNQLYGNNDLSIRNRFILHVCCVRAEEHFALSDIR